jgi:NodT family efflux transporter outer membrane factor (OMF) lipoprotein
LETGTKNMPRSDRQYFARSIAYGVLAVLLSLAGCSVGPKYQRASASAPAAYKELTPEAAKDLQGWQLAQPNDTAIRGKWWEIFNDPELNDLEEKANNSNQSIAAAASSFLAARAMVQEARSQLFPTVTSSPAITAGRQPTTTAGTGIATGTTGTTGVSTTTTQATGTSRNYSEFSLPFDASWQPDLWGRVRKTIASDVAAAQASAADLANVRLTVQAELAVDYFQLRTEDALKQLLDSTVQAYQQSLDLTVALYETGIDSDEAVAQAQTQLQTTQAQDTAVDILRAQYEHAVATLIGQPAPAFSLPFVVLNPNPQPIPFGIPSQLLERRPDISAAERAMAQANAQIGIVTAAYYPTVTLTGEAGFASTAITTWFTWPSRFWSVGTSLAETIFDAGLRRATVRQYRAAYDQTVANYRATVLTAFQQVEDNLAGLRILSTEIQQQDAAVQSAQKNLTVATDRYRLGIDPYLNVITAQTTLLTSQQVAVNLRLQQMTAHVQLIEALGGGWGTTQLPSASSVALH